MKFPLLLVLALLVACSPRPASPLPPVLTGKDGMKLLLVPAGLFLMGSEDGDDDERPAHLVTLPDFYIDQHPVTNAQFARFLNEVGHQPDWYRPGQAESGLALQDGEWRVLPGKADHAANGVSYDGARAYAAWAGRRLPTEAEWEKAARGTDGRRYPWGDDWHPDRSNGDGVEDGYPGLAPVGAFPKGASPYGALDMVGTVWEWVDTDYRPYPYVQQQGPPNSPVNRGGSWRYNSHRWSNRATERGWDPPFVTDDDYGFRCATDPPATVEQALEAGEVDRAREMAERQVARRPRDPEAHAALGEALENEGDFAAAAEAYLEAGRVDPANPMWQFRAVDAQVLVDPEAAEALARRLARRMPGAAGAHERLARALAARVLRGGDRALLDAALREADRAVAMEPSAETLLTRAQILYLRNPDDPAAARQAEEALESGLRSDNAVEVMNWLGWMAFRGGDVPGASKWYRRAMEEIATSGEEASHARIQPRWETYGFYRVVFCGERIPMTEFRKMEPLYRELAAAGMIDQPLYEFSREYLYNVLEAWYAGDTEKALQVTKEFMATPDPEERTESRPRGFFSEAVEEPAERLLMPLVYAELYRAAGERERARYHYRRALRLLPGHPVIRERMEDL